MKFILASASPRREMLMNKILKEYEIIPSQITEKTESEYPDKMALENALAKANDIAEKNPDAIVFGFDTVIVHDYKMLGKPKDLEHAKEMLASLSGESHIVVTAYVIVHKCRDVELTNTIFSTLTFKNWTKEQMNNYVEEFQPLDKAGSYGIQEIPEEYIDSLVGSYSNVMGLPQEDFQEALEDYLGELAEEVYNTQ